MFVSTESLVKKNYSNILVLKFFSRAKISVAFRQIKKSEDKKL